MLFLSACAVLPSLRRKLPRLVFLILLHAVVLLSLPCKSCAWDLGRGKRLPMFKAATLVLLRSDRRGENVKTRKTGRSGDIGGSSCNIMDVLRAASL